MSEYIPIEPIDFGPPILFDNYDLPETKYDIYTETRPRPPRTIDPKLIYRKATYGVTWHELEAEFGIGRNTLRNHFEQAYNAGKVEQANKLRWAQQELALNGDTSTLKWMAKQYLGQTEDGQRGDETRGVHIPEKYIGVHSVNAKKILLKYISRGIPPNTVFLIMGHNKESIEKWMIYDPKLQSDIDQALAKFEASALSQLADEGQVEKLLQHHPVLGARYQDKQPTQRVQVEIGFTRTPMRLDPQPIQSQIIDVESIPVEVEALPVEIARPDLRRDPRASINKALAEAKSQNDQVLANSPLASVANG